MANLDRLGWTAGLALQAYGMNIGLRVTDPHILDQLPNYFPPGWKPSSSPTVHILYSLIVGGEARQPGLRRYHLLYADATRLVRTMNLDEVCNRLGSHMQLQVAAHSPESLFVHAGVVGWNGQAIIIPGRSFSGKTTLVAALLKAGATYYSDEYALLDQEGRVWPYPRLLALRDETGQPDRKCEPTELGAEVGSGPLPVGVVLVTEYQAGSTWQAQPLSPSEAVLALISNTVAARRQPKRMLSTLQRVISGAKVVQSQRPEAEQVVEQVLNLVSSP